MPRIVAARTGAGLVRRLALASFAGVAAAATARADVVTFHLSNVHWHNTTYIGNTTMPWVLDWYGSGSFTWTYTPGDFENGHGTLLNLQLPPWGVGPGGYATATVVDTNGISTTLVQNVDSLTYDIAFNFSPALSGPTATVNLTGGSYQFYPGYYQFLSGEFDGTIIGGTAAVCATVVGQPSPVVLCGGGPASFSVAAGGSTPITYAWRRNGAPIDVAQNPSAATPTLQLNAAVPTDAGSYDCVVTNACGDTTSNAARLTVNTADFNGDGDVGTDADIAAFFACLAGNCCTDCGSADFNGDGSIGTDADIESFFRVLAGGAC